MIYWNKFKKKRESSKASGQEKKGSWREKGEKIMIFAANYEN